MFSYFIDRYNKWKTTPSFHNEHEFQGKKLKPIQHFIDLGEMTDDEANKIVENIKKELNLR